MDMKRDTYGDDHPALSAGSGGAGVSLATGVPTAMVVTEAQRQEEQREEREEQRSEEDVKALVRAKKRLPIEGFFYGFNIVVQIINLATMYVFIQEIGRQHTASQALQPSQTPSQSLVDATAAIVAAGRPRDEVCDAGYFASNGYAPVQNELNSLYLAAQVLWYFCLFPNAVWVAYRLGHMRQLWAASQGIKLQVVRRKAGGKGTFLRPGSNPDTNPIGVLNIGDLSLKGRIDFAERMSLRGESSGYIIFALIQDIPQVMIFFLFIAFVNRYRGLDCAQCLATTAQVCYTPSLWSASSDSYATAAVGGTFLSVVWNYVTILTRWLFYAQQLSPPWGVAKQVLAVLISTVAFVLGFISPIAALFAAYLEPVYYQWGNQTGIIILAAIAFSVFAVCFFFFAAGVGLAPGENSAEGLFCYNWQEILLLAFPFVACLEVFGLCCWCDCS